MGNGQSGASYVGTSVSILRQYWYRRCWILPWPPAPHTVRHGFLHSTVSASKPMVKIEVAASSNFHIYNTVVFPPASSPTNNILVLVLPAKLSQSRFLRVHKAVDRLQSFICLPIHLQRPAMPPNVTVPGYSPRSVICLHSSRTRS